MLYARKVKIETGQNGIQTFYDKSIVDRS